MSLVIKNVDKSLFNILDTKYLLKFKPLESVNGIVEHERIIEVQGKTKRSTKKNIMVLMSQPENIV